MSPDRWIRCSLHGAGSFYVCSQAQVSNDVLMCARTRYLHDTIVVCDCSFWRTLCCPKGKIPAFDSLTDVAVCLDYSIGLMGYIRTKNLLQQSYRVNGPEHAICERFPMKFCCAAHSFNSRHPKSRCVASQLRKTHPKLHQFMLKFRISDHCYLC